MDKDRKLLNMQGYKIQFTLGHSPAPHCDLCEFSLNIKKMMLVMCFYSKKIKLYKTRDLSNKNKIILQKINYKI